MFKSLQELSIKKTSGLEIGIKVKRTIPRLNLGGEMDKDTGIVSPNSRIGNSLKVYVYSKYFFVAIVAQWNV